MEGGSVSGVHITIGVAPICQSAWAGRNRHFDISRMTNDEAVKAFGWLVERLSRQYVRPGLELEDLKQEGYLGLFKAVEQWKAEAGATFVTLAASRIRDAMRGAVSSSRADGLSLDEVDDDGLSLHERVGAPAEQEDLASAEEDAAAVRAALSKMSAKDRELLEMIAVGDSHPMIARRRGIPRQTVQRHCSMALARLHDEIVSAA